VLILQRELRPELAWDVELDVSWAVRWERFFGIRAHRKVALVLRVVPAVVPAGEDIDAA
jgi:hypothetical protein